MSAAYDHEVRYCIATEPLPEAPCVSGRMLAAVWLSEAKDVLAVLNCRSAAPLLARPPLVPTHDAVRAPIVKFHGRLDLTVAVRPASSLEVGANAALAGVVRGVVAGVRVSLLELGTPAEAVVF